jgi:hypothetical protein
MHWPPEFGKVFMILEDGFSRRFHYLRLSVTEACNFRCTYCLPDGYRPDGRKSFLTVDEIRRVDSHPADSMCSENYRPLLLTDAGNESGGKNRLLIS